MTEKQPSLTPGGGEVGTSWQNDRPTSTGPHQACRGTGTITETLRSGAVIQIPCKCSKGSSTPGGAA